MAIFADLKRKREIKKYASELPRRLYGDYGASTFFTPGQIATAVRKLKLDPAFIVYGYAMFLSEEAFASLQLPTPNQLSYGDARATFVKYTPVKPSATANFYDFGGTSGASGFGDGGHGGGHDGGGNGF